MLENNSNQPNSIPNEHDLTQSALQWMQQQLDKQGVNVSPDEALKLFVQQRLHSARRWLQQDLVQHGIDATPDEALAIRKLYIIQRMMEYTVTTDPHDAIERMAYDDSPKPYEPNE